MDLLNGIITTVAGVAAAIVAMIPLIRLLMGYIKDEKVKKIIDQGIGLAEQLAANYEKENVQAGLKMESETKKNTAATYVTGQLQAAGIKIPDDTIGKLIEAALGTSKVR